MEVPIRTCAGCKSRRSQDELIRVVRGADGSARVDPGPRGKAPGRGIYVCPELPCIEEALKGGFRRTLKYDGAEAEALRRELVANSSREREGNDGEAQGS
jgi:predicted RNA-binding protein YlxR (DUF448 family)